MKLDKSLVPLTRPRLRGAQEFADIFVQEHIVGVDLLTIVLERFSGSRSTLISSLIQPIDKIIVEWYTVTLGIVIVGVEETVDLSLVRKPTGIVPFTFHGGQKFEEIFGIIFWIFLALTIVDKGNEIQVHIHGIWVGIVCTRHDRVAASDKAEFQRPDNVEVPILRHNVGHYLQELIGSCQACYFEIRDLYKITYNDALRGVH